MGIGAQQHTTPPKNTHHHHHHQQTRFDAEEARTYPLGVPGLHRLLPRLETDHRAREAGVAACLLRGGPRTKELQALPGTSAGSGTRNCKRLAWTDWPKCTGRRSFTPSSTTTPSRRCLLSSTGARSLPASPRPFVAT